VIKTWYCCFNVLFVRIK